MGSGSPPRGSMVTATALAPGGIDAADNSTRCPACAEKVPPETGRPSTRNHNWYSRSEGICSRPFITRYQRDRVASTNITPLAAAARTLSSERSELSGELGASQGDTLSRLEIAERQVAEKAAVRDGLAKKVEVTLYRRYEMIRKRKGTAIAHTTKGTCSACHMQLRPMLFQELLRGDSFSQCPSCNRIIYYRAVVPAGASESSDA